MKAKLEHMKTGLRASWRTLLVSLLRVTRRVQSGLEKRVQQLPGH